jgi:putative ABC transport system substrate-binding protein
VTASAETVGVILTNNEVFHDKAHEVFLSYLEEKGYKDRLKFIVQKPHADPIAWSNAARKLIAADVDIMVTYGAPALLSALNERSRIPIIYADVYEPVAMGIKAKKATGVYTRLSISSLLRYIRGTTSGKDIGVVYSILEEDTKHEHSEIIELSKKYGLNVISLELHNPLDTVGLLAKVNVSSILLTSSSMINSVFPTVMRIARSKKVPVSSLIYSERLLPTIMLSSRPDEHGSESAAMLVKFLNGVPFEEITPVCSKEIELVFNAAEARKMGFRIPMDLVTEATRIIY